MRWAHEYETERQYEDALAVYELQFAKLDMPYLERSVETLSLQDIWRRMQAEVQPLHD